MPQAPVKKPNPEQLAKLEQGYRYVTIPSTDLYDHTMDSIWINQLEFKPGTHLVSAEIADTLEDRLRVFTAQNIRLMRPTTNKDASKTMAKQGVYLGAPAPADPAFNG